MKTTSKYRRLIRQRKLRRQRSTALLVFIALIVLVANVAFSNQSADNEDVIAVTVKNGDTIWSIAKEYMPEDVNFSAYVHSISANNGVKDGNIYVGQVLYVPVES